MENELEAELILLNCQAINNLENPKRALKLLQEAETTLLSENSKVKKLPNRLNLLAVTFNNLACYYKSVKQPNVALFYLNQALALEIETFAGPDTVASTYLNLCAIYSQLGQHKKSLQSAFSALKYLKGYEVENETNESITNSLLVAHYNIGVEYEYIKNYSKAIEYFQKG